MRINLGTRCFVFSTFALLGFILLFILSSCSRSNSVDLSGKWNAQFTIDLCGTEYIEKSELEFISEGNKIVKIIQTYINGIDYAHNDPKSCEEEALTDTFVIQPQNLPKFVTPLDLRQFLPEWDGMSAAHSYSIKKFSKDTLIVRAVLSGNMGNIQTRTFTR